MTDQWMVIRAAPNSCSKMLRRLADRSDDEGVVHAVISVVPLEVASGFAEAYGLKIVPLDERWSQRRFIICFRDEQSLSPAAQLLVAHLASLPMHDSASLEKPTRSA